METQITGYYGCKCHPFASWDDLKKFEKQKLTKDDKVIHRCNGKKGIILGEVKGFVTVKFGNKKSDIELDHVANLIKI